jgi:nitrogen fixation/metabolism regulation signal transduction histidine kinase
LLLPPPPPPPPVGVVVVVVVVWLLIVLVVVTVVVEGVNAILNKVREWQGKTRLLKFLADAGFLCGSTSVTAVVW